MANGNPFYIQKGPGIGPGLAQLGQTMMDIGKQKREEAAKQRAVERFDAMKQGAMEAYQSGDPEKMIAFGLGNPEMANAMFKMAGIETEEAKDQRKQELFAKFQEGDLEAEKELAWMFPEQLSAFKKAIAIPVTEDTRTKEQKNYEYAKAEGYEGTFADYVKGTPVGKWQPWGYGQMRNTETGEIKDVQVPPQRGEIIRSLPGGGFEIVRGEPGAKPKKFSEVQAKSGGFATRVEAANEIAGTLEDKLGFDPASISEAIAGAIPGFGNILSSEDRQVYNQAKADFITAVLRLESGAAISPAEFEKEEKKYFPQPGDKPKVIENKRKARERQFGILKGASGGAYDAMKETESATQPSPEPAKTFEELSRMNVGDMTEEELKRFVRGE